MKQYVIILMLAITVLSCNKNTGKNDDISPELILTSSNTEFQDAAANRSSDISDPFIIDTIVFSGDTAEITVSYSGGCQQHTFEIIWDETLTDSEPPQTGLIILHDANGDMCEAWITETLAFDIADLTGTICFDGLYVNVFNGGDPGDSTSSGGWDPSDTTGYDDDSYKIVFTESNECVVKVTASRVICGAGLYGNLWLALEDSISAGLDGYFFRKYLQPVAIDASIAGFVPVQGKQYNIGARKQEVHDYLNVPVCMAYSGPSVPVKIMCIEESR